MNELLFSLPNQYREFPNSMHAKNYYKMGFDEECLSRLPGKYPFLLNPLNRQKIIFPSDAADRLQNNFAIIRDLLSIGNCEPQLILAYLHTLLTEIDTAYFRSEKWPAGDRLEKFIGFKIFVEANLTHQPAITDIADQLSISTDSLYRLVKQYAGVSPKEFITDRLMMEARRRIYYEPMTSVKELAFELGFNDPDYFSRLFKKVTGKTIAAFYQDLS
jgi:AraC-like DNA-binding protein